ncbi:MOSC domain-containing protein [Sorangium sp. So ce131]|uniref:MOSC domain-containing protein n=1 Tax=Sorangium sp. So ce131 TaxID=3133282 RepID=UPI003F5F7789
MRSLRERLAHVPQVGRVEWLGVRPAHGAPMQPLREAELIASRGVAGDCAAAGRAGGKRQVTLIQGEHLPVIAALAGGRAEVKPELLRRNVVVSGVNLLSLSALRFALGDEVVLEGTGPCAPCGAMDEALGEGGFQAMRGHGGITARVLRGGVVRVGDVVRALSPGEGAPSPAEQAGASSPGEQGGPATG